MFIGGVSVQERNLRVSCFGASFEMLNLKEELALQSLKGFKGVSQGKICE